MINSQGSIYYLGASGYIQLPGAGSAVAPINGGLFVLAYPTNTNGNGLYYYNLDTPGWTAQSGAGISISTNGTSLYVISASGTIYSSPVSKIGPPPAATPQAVYAATFTYVNSTANGIEEFALNPLGLLAASPFSLNYGQLGTGAPGGPPTVLFGYSAPNGIAVNSVGRADIVDISYPSSGYPLASNIDIAPCTVGSPGSWLTGWRGGGGSASFDANDNLWQLGNSGATSSWGITEYPAPQNQTPTTVTTAAVGGGFSQLTRGGNAIAIDGSQNLWTLGTDSQANAAVLNLGVSPHGTVAPVSSIHGILTQLQNPVGVAIAPNNTVYVANSNAILAYGAGAVGNVAPVAVISGSNTRISAVRAIAVDALGDIFVGQAAAPQILEFAANSNGNVSPIATVATQGSTVSALAVGPLPFSQPMTVHPASMTLNGQQSNEVIVWDGTCSDQLQFVSDNAAVYRAPSAIQNGHGLVVSNNATTTGTAHVTATSSTGQSAVFTVTVVATPPPAGFPGPRNP